MSERYSKIGDSVKKVPLQSRAGGRDGSVSLIGCGPGDPDLLTLRAQKRIRQADVLVVDRLVNLAALEHARDGAERIYVGKTPGGKSTPQVEINRILVREAGLGKRVARLKGGDPFVFGRAVEEISALESAGVAYEIVPGVTAALACAASVALPVTSRGRNRRFTVLTGATADGRLDHDWAALVRDGEAFGVYMGVRNASAIARGLLASGIGADTAVVIVENGTMPNERSYLTSVADLQACVEEREIEGPAMIYVGLEWDALGISKPAKVEHFSADADGDAEDRDRPAVTPRDGIPFGTAG